VALLTAVQVAMGDDAVTLTKPVEAVAPTVADVAPSENCGAAAAWVTPRERPAIEMAPDLELVAVFAATE
jgi:hypothetical protein